MANTYKSTDKLLEDYNYLSDARKNKADKYIKNLVRIEQAERGINWAETEIKRDMKKVNIDDHEEYYCSFCGKPSKDVKKMIAGPHEVFICDECVGICGEILEEEMGTDGGEE